jgi:hypothetical protein
MDMKTIAVLPLRVLALRGLTTSEMLLKTRRQLERGDADSAGSTLRTVLVVGVIVAVLAVLRPAIVAAAEAAAAALGAR